MEAVKSFFSKSAHIGATKVPVDFKLWIHCVKLERNGYYVPGGRSTFGIYLEGKENSMIGKN